MNKKYLILLSTLLLSFNLKPVLENWVCPDLPIIQSAEFTVEMANALSDETPGGTPSAYARLTSCKTRSIFLLKAACMALRQFQEICTAPELQTLKNNIALTSATLISEVLPLSQNTTPVIDPELGEMSFSSSFAQSIPRRDIVFTAFPPAAVVSQDLVLKSLFLMLSDLFDLLELINAQPAADLYISKETFNPREFGIAEIILTKTKDSIELVNTELLNKIYDYFAAVALILEPSVIPLAQLAQQATARPSITTLQAETTQPRRVLRAKRTVPPVAHRQKSAAPATTAPRQIEALSVEQASLQTFKEELLTIALDVYRKTLRKNKIYYSRIEAKAFELKNKKFNEIISDEQVRRIIADPEFLKSSIAKRIHEIKMQQKIQTPATETSETLPAVAPEQNPSEFTSATTAAPTRHAIPRQRRVPQGIFCEFRKELHDVACQIHEKTKGDPEAYFLQLKEAAETLRHERFVGQITDEEIASLISSKAFSKNRIASDVSFKRKKDGQTQADEEQALNPPAPYSQSYNRAHGYPPEEEHQQERHAHGISKTPVDEIPRLGFSDNLEPDPLMSDAQSMPQDTARDKTSEDELVRWTEQQPHQRLGDSLLQGDEQQDHMNFSRPATALPSEHSPLGELPVGLHEDF